MQVEASSTTMPIADVGKMLEFLFKSTLVTDCAFPQRAFSDSHDHDQLSFSSRPDHHKAQKVYVYIIQYMLTC